MPEGVKNQINEFISRKEDKAELDELFDVLLDWCDESEKELVLIIDEVDSATNNQVFLDFLAQLRDMYLRRNSKGTPAFKSVILAGVTDVKNLKRNWKKIKRNKNSSMWKQKNYCQDFIIKALFQGR